MKANKTVCALAVLLISIFNSPLAENHRSETSFVGSVNGEQLGNEIDVAKYGADCSGHKDSSAILNGLTSERDISSNRIISTRGCAHLRLDQQWLIFGQENLNIYMAGTVISGCTGGPGAVILINRSGNLIIQGGVIEAKGNDCVSRFTGSIEIRNVGRGGYTSTHNIFRDVFLTSNVGGTRISNYVGFYINGSPNGELFQLGNVSIHCQLSSGSRGFWSTDNNADSTTIDGKSRINGCYRGVQIDGGGGHVDIYNSNVSGNGGYSIFGSGGATIYENNGGCVGILLGNVTAEASGQYIADTGSECRTTIIGNAVSFEDIDPAVYPIEAPRGTYIVGNNDFHNGGLSISIHNNTVIGSDINGQYGPYGCLNDLGGNLLGSNGKSQYNLTNQSWQLCANVIQSYIGPAVSEMTGAFSNYGGHALRTSTGLVAPGLGMNAVGNYPAQQQQWPGAANHLLLGDGVVEVTGLPSGYLARLDAAVAGIPGTQKLALVVIGKDGHGNRTTPSAAAYVRNAPNVMDSSNYITVDIRFPFPEVSSYDILCLRNGTFGAIATNVALPYKIKSNPTCTGYTLPNYNETAGIVLRAPLGVTSYGDFKFVADNNNDIGSSAAHRPRTGYFGTSLVTPKLEGITDTGELARLNSGLWHGKSAIDFSSKLSFGLLAKGSCAEKTLAVPGAVVQDAVAPAWPPMLESGLFGMMMVSASDTVKVRLCNLSDSRVDLGIEVFGGRVIK